MYRTVKLLAVVAGIASLVAVAPAQEKQKQVKDADEHKLFTTAATPGGDPKARLAALEEWLKKYPESDFKLERLLLFIDAHKSLNQGAKMWDVSKEVLKLDPNNATAHYWLTALVETMPPGPDTWATGEASAKALVALPKPANVQQDAWDKMLKGEFSPLAYKTLGFIGSAKKDYPMAETNYKKALEFQPNFGIVSYALGAAIIAQKNPDRYSEALYHMARAVSLRGVGEVPAQVRSGYDAFLTKAYNTYHGSPEGLDDLKALSAKSAVWPNHHIDSVAEIAEKKDKDLLASDPQLAIWLRVKGQLTSDNGQAYFDNELKGSAVPKLKGKVVSATPEAKPKEIIVGVEHGDKEEIKLVITEGGAMATKAEPGTPIEFEGVPSAFQKEPFLLTMDVEKAKISGWPEAPKPARRPAAKKGAAKKK